MVLTTVLSAQFKVLRTLVVYPLMKSQLKGHPLLSGGASIPNEDARQATKHPKHG